METLPEAVVVLHDIRSALNVGSIFRTADAAGVKHIFLTGYTPAPIDRFGREEKTIAKTALGAEKTVSWEQGDIASVITELQRGHIVVGVEQSQDAQDYRAFFKQATRIKRAYIFGNEVEGLEESVLKQCDTIIEIPMRGDKESLNVAVAAGIILFAANN